MASLRSTTWALALMLAISVLLIRRVAFEQPRIVASTVVSREPLRAASGSAAGEQSPVRVGAPPEPSLNLGACPPPGPARGCWRVPAAARAYPFNESMASIVWSRPLQTAHGPLDDVSHANRARAWPPRLREELFGLLPEYARMRSLRYGSCAVVGSSPEVLMYSDGAEIDEHDAVFRANGARTRGFEAHVGRRTTVRVINPVESFAQARAPALGGVAQGGDETVVVKNQDPPSIRDPSAEHAKFVAEKRAGAGAGAARPPLADYLARRHIMELCNFMFLQSGVALADPELRGRSVDLGAVARRFGQMAASGEWATWHPLGDSIPRFSALHCSTGTVLLTEALLLCDTVRIYGFHACKCERACANASGLNHYWDRAPTKDFGRMAQRYTSHLRFYQRLREACDFDFDIARLEHCDVPPPPRQRGGLRRRRGSSGGGSGSAANGSSDKCLLVTGTSAAI